MDNGQSKFYNIVNSNFDELNFKEKKKELERVYDIIIPDPTKDIFNILRGNINGYMENIKEEIKRNGAFIHLFWKKQKELANEKISEYLDNYNDDGLCELNLMATYVKLKSFVVNCNFVYDMVIEYQKSKNGFTGMNYYLYNMGEKRGKKYLSIQQFCEEHKVCIPESEFHNKDILNILNGKYISYMLKPKYYKYIALFYMFNSIKTINTDQTLLNYLFMAENLNDKYASFYRFCYNRHILDKYNNVDEPTELLQKLYDDNNIDDILYELAEIQFDWYGRDVECIKYLEEGVEKNNIFCINMLAEIYESMGKIKEARKYSEIALKRGFSRNIQLMAMRLDVDEKDIANYIKWYLNTTNSIMFFDYFQQNGLYSEITLKKLRRIEELVNDNRFVINWKIFEKYGN